MSEDRKESLPALILLDLNLPRKHGFEMLEAMHGSDSLPRIPVTVFSASASIEDQKSALSRGASLYLVKPSTYDGYISTLGEVVRRAHQIESSNQ